MNGMRATQTAGSSFLEPASTTSVSTLRERARSSTQLRTSVAYETPLAVGMDSHRLALDPHIAAIQRARLFSDLSLGDCTQVACRSRKRQYRRQEILLRQGETVQHVCLVLSGIAKITHVGPDGEEVILCLRGPGDLLGIGMPAGRPSESNAETLEPACVLLWDVATMRDLETQFPTLRHRAFEILHDQLHEMQQRFRELATEKVALRVARAVVRAFAAAQMYRPGVVHITLSREELAQMTGTTVFAVSRLLSEWTKDGIIDGGRRFIVVHNASKLLEHAAGGPAIAA